MKIEQRIPKHNQQYQLQNMDDENLLYNPMQTKTIYLNATATLIWKMCDGHNSIEKITEQLIESFPESKSTIPSDVMNSINELVSQQALILE